MVCLFIVGTSFHFFEKPVKSYRPERGEIINEIAKETDYCVYISADESTWRMWEDYIYYPQFKELYFIDGKDQKPIFDETLQKQEQLLIYIDTRMDLEETYQYLKKYLPFRNYDMKYEASYTYLVMASK